MNLNQTAGSRLRLRKSGTQPDSSAPVIDGFEATVHSVTSGVKILKRGDRVVINRIITRMTSTPSRS